MAIDPLSPCDVIHVVAPLKTATEKFELDARASATYALERRRACMSGVLETASTTFLLLIAVRWFDASPTMKWLIVSGPSWGLLLGPLVVFLCARSGLAVGRAAALICLVGAFCFLLGAFTTQLAAFAFCSVLATALLNSVIPLATQLYQDNYPARVRGRLFSQTTLLRIAIGGLFAASAGYGLTGRLQSFPLVLLAFAVSMLISADCFRRCPSQAIVFKLNRSPFEGFRYLKSDKLFANTLICWMCMGFGNLMMLPMRVEYLANARYGLALSEWEVAMLVTALPNAARLLVSPIWGAMFDRMNFFRLRIAINIGFGLGILSFFQTSSVFGLLSGAILFGVSNAGGEIAWSLWVTKFAPAERVADYMSVHTFLTGVRGLLAPLVAFHLVDVISLSQLGLISAALVLGANFWILPFSRRVGGSEWSDAAQCK